MESDLKSFVVLFALSLLGAAHAVASCEQPSAPQFPANGPIDERAEKRLSRAMVRYISAEVVLSRCYREVLGGRAIRLCFAAEALGHLQVFSGG